jgi:hypothetical protein
MGNRNEIPHIPKIESDWPNLQNECCFIEQSVLDLFNRALIDYRRFLRPSLSSQLWQYFGVPAAALIVSYCLLSLTVTIGNIALPAVTTVTVYFLTGIAITLAIAWRIRTAFAAISVSSRSRTARFRLGRMEDLLGPRAIMFPAVLLGTMFGIELALLDWGHRQTGLAASISFADSFAIATDNLLSGLLFDCCELFDIRFAEPPQHTSVSATLFLVFRTAFDLFVVYLIYVVVQRRQLARLVHEFGVTDENVYLAVDNWIDHVVRSPTTWIRSYPNEVVFFMVVREFLAGRFDDARSIAAEWPSLKINSDARSLLTDPTGVSIFADSQGS